MLSLPSVSWAWIPPKAGAGDLKINKAAKIAITITMINGIRYRKQQRQNSLQQCQNALQHFIYYFLSCFGSVAYDSLHYNICENSTMCHLWLNRLIRRRYVKSPGLKWSELRTYYEKKHEIRKLKSWNIHKYKKTDFAGEYLTSYKNGPGRYLDTAHNLRTFSWVPFFLFTITFFANWIEKNVSNQEKRPKSWERKNSL